MTLPFDLTADRALVQSGMTDNVVFRHPGDRHADPIDARGKLTHAAGATVYDGKCTIVVQGAAEIAAGGTEADQVTYTVELPFDAAVPKIGDVGEITAAGDPLLVEKFLTVYELPPASSRTVVRRVKCRERPSAAALH